MVVVHSGRREYGPCHSAPTLAHPNQRERVHRWRMNGPFGRQPLRDDVIKAGLPSNGRRKLPRRERRLGSCGRRATRLLLHHALHHRPVHLAERVLRDRKLAPVRRDMPLDDLGSAPNRFPDRTAPTADELAREVVQRFERRVHLLQQQSRERSRVAALAVLRTDRMPRELERARTGTGSDAEEEAKVLVDEGGLEGAGAGGGSEGD